MRKVILMLAVLLVVIGYGSIFGSKLNLTTYANSEFMLKPDSTDTWRMEDGTQNKYPSTMFELKLDINIDSLFSIFMKTSTYNVLDKKTVPGGFSIADLHLTFKKDMGGKGMEVIAYRRETGYFWLDQPLLRFTDDNDSWAYPDNDNKGANGMLSGIYFNIWNMFGLNLVKGFIISRGWLNPVIPEEGESIGAALRLRKDLLGGNLKIGATGVFTRRISDPANTNDLVPPSHRVAGFDIDIKPVSPVQFVFEGGVGDYDEDNRTNYSASQFYTFKTELRSTLDLKSFGVLSLLGSVLYVDDGFPNWRGNTPGGGNFYEEAVEINYAFPLKAINLKQVFKLNHKVTGWSKDNFHLWNYSFDPLNESYYESYSELYVEFKNGFKFKSYYKHFEGGEYVYGIVRGVWRHLLFQLEVENKFSKIKPQVLLLNFDNSDYRAFGYGGEVLINITDKVKFFTRFALMQGSKNSYYASNEGKSNWGTFFAELQFFEVLPNTKFFITFGNGDHTNDDLVNDKNDGILNGRVLEKRLKFFLEFWL